MTVLLSNLSARLRHRMTTGYRLSPGVPVHKTAPGADGPISTANTDMSKYPMARHSDLTLARMKTFFDHYRPNRKDAEWAERKKAEVAAEIRRREQEDKEGAR